MPAEGGNSEFISIHPPRMGWDAQPRVGIFTSNGISIHPPRMGWDLSIPMPGTVSAPNFNPPTPHGVGRV